MALFIFYLAGLRYILKVVGREGEIKPWNRKIDQKRR